MPLTLLYRSVSDIVLCRSSVLGAVFFLWGHHTVLSLSLLKMLSQTGIVHGRALLPPTSMAQVCFGGSQRKTSAPVLFE